MKLAAYMEYIKKQEIPPEPPDHLTPGDINYALLKGMESVTAYFEARKACNVRGLWTVIDCIWTKQLAEWIGTRRVLEVMAGLGWLAKALSAYGVSINATDNYSWENRQHRNGGPILPVERIDAVKAVKKYSFHDILLMSWPPYDDDIAYEVIKEWKDKGPIIYVGENQGGCNANDKFWEVFETVKSPGFPMVSWPGMHDFVMIGKYSRRK